MTALPKLRQKIRSLGHMAEEKVIAELLNKFPIDEAQRARFSNHAATLINNIRGDDQPGLMEVFLSEYGLSTDEGVALMCLAEALLRVPDTETIDDLIEDKIAPSSWGSHLGQSSSPLVNASTWALMLTGKVLDADKDSPIASVLHGAIKRLGEPVIRTAVKRAMKEMAKQFVLGETIDSAMKEGAEARKKGFTYSYDMLGEAAMTAADAQRYFDAYKQAILRIGHTAKFDNIQKNPGISIKLSALHPRYEVSQKARVMSELTERTLALTRLAKEANIGINIDAEEADRLGLSLDIIETVLSNSELTGWDGLGIVVQAYNKRASAVIDWLYELATQHDRRIMVRLVKGAYWDTEIKRAQVEGFAYYPVYTRKSATDVSYICCAQQLLQMGDRIYAQFATHNEHSVAAILDMAPDKDSFEFQRLHGMGSVLHRQVMESEKTHCRVYAPVGEHVDLLAYLVRRLLENGANSSFVNQIVDEDIPAQEIAADPFHILKDAIENKPNPLTMPADIFLPERQNSRGWDIHDYQDLAAIETARAPFKIAQWQVQPIIDGKVKGGAVESLKNPANPDDIIGSVTQASADDVKKALERARIWSSASAVQRAAILNKAADLFEENFGEIFAVLTREAGKVIPDAIAELREAVDFLRYYAAQATTLAQDEGWGPRGIITCISPWNFPLAIFTGQISAALAGGNAVLAKPAESTPIIASIAIKLLHKAGVPKSALQLLTGKGSKIGAALMSEGVDGVCFTGSTATAKIIHRTMAENLDPDAPLIAETGGLNAMIVDSTALAEQAVGDVIASAFQSAGQRCSALRLLYIQSDVAPLFMKMLLGALEEQNVGDPWNFDTDIGPIITAAEQNNIASYIAMAKSEGRLIKAIEVPKIGAFVSPAIISVKGLADLKKEVFGPVLHASTFEAHEVPKLISDINASGYGLTFGLHTRLDNRVEYITQNLKVGNIYVNRNQIGAVVGSQPFGGEGLSGTGPKAGGPHYVKRFTVKAFKRPKDQDLSGKSLSLETVQKAITENSAQSPAALSTIEMPGPTGESNQLSEYPKGLILCLGPGWEDGQKQAKIARSKGCPTIIICDGAKGDNTLDGFISPDRLSEFNGITGVAFWGSTEQARKIKQALARREGPIVPLMGPADMEGYCVSERHVCIDTTASGGNVSLLSGT